MIRNVIKNKNSKDVNRYTSLHWIIVPMKKNPSQKLEHYRNATSFNISISNTPPMNKVTDIKDIRTVVQKRKQVDQI